MYCTVCNHAVERLRTLKSNHITCPGFEIKEGFAQTFFPRSHHGGYFAVTVPPQRRDPRPVNLVQRLKVMFPDPNPANVPMNLPENPADSNHFLSMQKWVPTLNGLTPAEIRFATREVNPDLRELVSGAVGGYMREIDESLAKNSTHQMRVAIGSFTGLVSLLSSPLVRGY